MSKVLISFLGTGSLDKSQENKQTNERRYRKAKYHFADGTEYESSFVAQALRSFYGIDRLILVGTVKSMWEEVYLTFAENPDDDYYSNLGNYCEKANHKSPLVLPEKEKLEASIGPDSKVVLIQYGLTEEEIKKNAEIILGIEQYLKKGDELYVDITHSFRSLPLFLMNTLIYLQNVSSKQISVKHITYGMLDVSRELGYAPVVELNSIMKMNEWITGAYSFQNFGNAYQIAQLIGDESQKKRLEKFSDLMNLNHLAGIEKQKQELSSFKNAEYSTPFAKMLVEPIVMSFINSFNTKTHSEFQLRLAQWHFDHKNYGSSYIALIEAIVTYVCEQNDLDWGELSNRSAVRSALNGKTVPSQYKSVTQLLFKIYKGTNIIRNAIAHTKETALGYTQMIKRLEENLQKTETIIYASK